MNSSELRIVLAQLDAAVDGAGQDYQNALHHHRLSTRRALLGGDYETPAATSAAVAAALEALEQTKLARDEAAALLAEALAAEKAKKEAAIRDELRAMNLRLAALASEADEAFAIFAGKVRAAQQVEAEARRLSETELGLTVYAGVLVPEAIDDCARFLRSLRSAAPIDFAPFVGSRAATSVQRITNGAAL